MIIVNNLEEFFELVEETPEYVMYQRTITDPKEASEFLKSIEPKNLAASEQYPGVVWEDVVFVLITRTVLKPKTQKQPQVLNGTKS